MSASHSRMCFFRAGVQIILQSGQINRVCLQTRFVKSARKSNVKIVRQIFAAGSANAEQCPAGGCSGCVIVFCQINIAFAVARQYAHIRQIIRTPFRIRNSANECSAATVRLRLCAIPHPNPHRPH